MSADRNLLFGILALQNDFVSRDELVEAMNAWVLAKHRPLGELLRERGALGRPQHDLLEAIVNLQVARHGGDVERSLQALPAAAGARAWLATVQDAEVKASLACVPAARPDDDPYATTAPASADYGGGAGQRYRVLRPHARGALGEVFVAEDQELHREVALKEIQSRHADDQYSRSRFILEAEITGRLEHPGIVPVYGLGCYGDGRPFYAMRFIRGDNLEHALERFHQPNPPAPFPQREGGEDKPLSSGFSPSPQRGGGRGERFASLDFRRLLDRFLGVCNAVAYAHSRGVLHRDLKPGNVMLGEFGETLVVDWGLAKVVGRASSPQADVPAGDQTLRPSSGSSYIESVAGAAVGTPVYMSPEQAEGKLDQLGPATDVYSLGATLYALLTGRPPIGEGPLAEVLERVRRGDIDWSCGTRVSAAPPALVAVCRKAMALRPGDRYPTALALAADVEHWLADEPVSAYREPWSVEARRWSRKHRTLVSGAAAGLVVTALALAAGLFVVTGFNERLTHANVELQQRQRIADENFSFALKVVEEEVFDIDQQLQYRPGTRALRGKLLKRATERLKDLVERASRRGVVDHTAVWAHVKLGDVFMEVDLRPERAGAEYEIAAEIARQRVRADSGNAEAQRDVWVSLTKLGDVARKTGKQETARDFYTQALELATMFAADSRDPRAQRDLSVSCSELGDVTRSLDQALALHAKALELRRMLLDAEPSSAMAKRDLSVSLIKLGDVMSKRDQTDRALQHYTEALGVNQARAEADPGDAQAQRDWSISYDRLGKLALQMGNLTKALEYFSQGLDLCGKRALADPGDAQAQYDLSVACERVGDVRVKLGQPAEALASYTESLRLRKMRFNADPSDARVQDDLLEFYERLGDLPILMGDADNALKLHSEVISLCETRLAARPGNAQLQHDLWASFMRLGDAALRLEQPAKAVQPFAQALQHSAQYAAAHPMEVQAQSDWSTSLNRMGRVHEALGRFHEAAEWFQKEIDLAGQWPNQLNVNLAWAKSKRMGCVAAVTLIDDFTRVADLPEPERCPGLKVVMFYLAHQKKEPERAAEAAELFVGMTKDAGDRYDAACVYSLCVPLGKDAAQKERYAGRAIELLRQAVQQGYKDAAHMKMDPDLDALRAREDFKKLQTELDGKPAVELKSNDKR